MARPQVEKPPAFPPPFTPMGRQAFVEMLPRWFVNVHEDHQALLDEIAMLPYAASLEYGVGQGGHSPTIRLVQPVNNGKEAALLLTFRANGEPLGAHWEAVFAVYNPGTSNPMYTADVYRKCSTNERAALVAFLERIPAL